MRILDLFCGAGGASWGYHLAGFEVAGIDVKAQPHYPFEFWKTDVFSPFVMSDDFMSQFDAIHASPPCQPFTALRTMPGYQTRAPDLVDEARKLMDGSGLPWVMENVPGAPMRADLTLCGTMFGLVLDGFELRRHRLFEISGFMAAQPSPCRHERYALGVYGHAGGKQVMGRAEGNKATSEQARKIMGIDWMTGAEISQAVPPAYTECIGRHLKRWLERAA